MAQETPPTKSTTIYAVDSSLIVSDSTKNLTDTTRNQFKETTGQDTIKMKNESGIETVVTILANDSSWREVKKNILHLFGGAKVKYEDFELSADYIRLDQNTNVLFARGIIDHNEKYIGRPVVIMPGESPIAVDSLLYNYKTRIPKTYGVMTEVDGGFIQAREVKRNIYDEMSLYQGLYSTCDLPYPHTHFGIQITKGLVAKNQIIAGPSYLVVQNIPIKFLIIPFGFFPKQDKKSSGFLFPSFGEDASRGFAMRDIGWYLTFNDYWDTELRGSLYSKGSWEASVRTQYMVNYKYNGGFNLRYAWTLMGVEGTEDYGPRKDFNVTWNHTQRQEANPGTSFSASVNFGTSSYMQNTGANGTYSYDQLIQNNMSSSIAYGKVFADGKVNFTSNLSHRQDINTGKVDLELPSFSLNVSTFNPFKSKNSIDEKWYERITVGYSLQGRNSISTGDSTLFSKESLSKFSNGFQHSIPISLNLNAFKYFQFNTSVNYTERWYLQTTRNRLENTVEGFETVRDTVQGFARAYDYSISTGLSTKVYGHFKKKIGNIQEMRHVITPSVNLNYRPDFSDPMYGFYRDYVDQNGALTSYSIFQEGIYGSPSAGKSMGIGFSVDNNLEAKIKSKNDTSESGIKKVPILQGLTFSGNYNVAADSMKLSNISFSGRTTIFNEKINLNFNGSFDPYSLDEEGRRINRYAIKDGNLARLTNFGLSFDYSFNPNANKSRSGNIDSLRNSMPNMTKEQADALARISTDPNAFVDFNIPWNLNGSFSFQYSKTGLTSSITSTVNVSGDVNVTPKWKIQFNSGYDFRAQEVSLTRFSIYRDLHCWDMSFSWVPFGQYQSYNVTIRAKASVLQDLKLTKQNTHYVY
ncbi:putative LPS assembly protein LptD [Sphingobacterium hungaricum]|uniref:putative LPS assembly protein LptD n=1 Tax=Sphingobacterium hungaricum TaxID=2082723 RepID=UPI001E4F3A66|nr:putative LPS assembly protein LptD [Sphingobacterium hungaricum]